jgi:CBS domain containing-hemolysin-like protein
VESSYLIIALIFLLSLILSGCLGAIRSVFLFFRTYHERIEDEALSQIAEKSITHWKREGYVELCSLGRLVLDGVAIILGTKHFLIVFSSSIPSLFIYPVTGLLAILIVYIIGHQLIPLLAQAYVTRTAKPLYILFSIYWLIAGWLGKSIYHVNRYILKKLGFIKKFKIVSETDLQKLEPDESSYNETGLEEDEAEMVQNIFNIRSILVKEIFTPRVDTVALDVNSSYKEVIEVIKTTRYTRIPVYQESIDNIKGVLHVKDLLALKEEKQNEHFDLKKVIRPAYFIPQSKKIDDLMTEFKIEHNHIAVVVDEYGGTAGIITLEDILEEIVGEIQDEDDRELPKILKTEEGAYLIDPIITLDDINKELDLALGPDEEVEIDTLGGFLQYIKGSVPQEGDKITSNGCAFEILKMEGQSIEKVRLTLPNSQQH